MNALLDGASELTPDASPDDLKSSLEPFLMTVSPDLAQRWRGALYSLSPLNPDAARHFCTSAREIVATILDVRAPDNVVLSTLHGCELTQKGTPTRRAKIRYFLHRNGLANVSLEGFIESDVENLVSLFKVFNQGTHGEAGAYNFAQLQAIRKRVEDGIAFLSEIVAPESQR